MNRTLFLLKGIKFNFSNRQDKLDQSLCKSSCTQTI